MGELNIEEAWKILGRDFDIVLATIGSLPRDRRIAAAEKILEKAKKIARVEAARHHPDKGGDPARFRAIWEAVKVIERSTEEFKLKMVEAERVREEKREKGTFIVRT